MANYKIKVRTEVEVVVNIEADSEEEAIELAETGDYLHDDIDTMSEEVLESYVIEDEE